MCTADFQESKEGIEIYFKSQGYKSKVQKEDHDLTGIQKEKKWEVIWGTPWLWFE